ncbi:SNF2 domain-containing protein CLASSY 3, partial [Nymphaea thermarum]
AVDCSRRKNAGVLHCSSNRKGKRAKEVILLSEEEEGSDHAEKHKIRKRSSNVQKGKTAEDDNDVEMREFARKKGCSSLWKGKEQSDASSRGSRRLWRTKVKCRKLGITICSSISGKGEKKGAIELMSSGDDNEDSTEVEKLVRRPLIQARKVKKIASRNSSRVARRREKASKKLNCMKKKRSLQWNEDEDEESISTSDDVEESVTDDDYNDADEEDVNLKERSTSPLRSYQEGMHSNVMKKSGKKTSGQHIQDHLDDQDTNDYGNSTDGNSCAVCTSTEKIYKKKKNKLMELSLFDLLMDTINEKRDIFPDEVKTCEEKIPIKIKLPLRWSPSESEREKSDSEGELDDLWNELNFVLRLNEISCPDWHETQGESTTNMTQSPSACRHQFLLDEQIGIVCKVCNYVKLEIKYAMPPMIQRMCGKSGKRVSREGEEISEVDDDGFKCQEFSTQGCNLKTFSDGTVWDLIPDLKEKMFQHQKEGFEFIWKTLGGGIAIKELKSTGSDDIGGCLISHAPGTGKTLLAIAFLRSFLLLFDDHRPMIVAPLILLSTWENEFKKWGIGVPFHILNRNDFSGKENGSVLEIFLKNQSKLGHGRKQNLRRMVKIFSWIRDKSILGISYHLFGKLTAEKQHGREGESIRNLLLEYPGLLLLDEGHIARNKQSKLWQCLKQVKTQRRIMLSGTPFQNNFDQLFSTLYLIRPNFAEGIFERFEDHPSCLDDQADEEYLLHEKNERVLRRSFATFSEGIEPEETSSQLKELRSIIDPFIHVHEGTIHELPGLIDYFVYLYPSPLQRCLLDKLTDRTNFDYDHKVSCICVHPSLLLRKSSQKDNEKDRAIIQEHILDLSKEQIHDGVKVRFVIELVQLCEAINEKILVFSQFIDPLVIIKRHLVSFFGWTDGREVLQLDGSIIDQKQRQSLIDTFNDMSKEVKVLLVSTRVCAEGIDLTGASRVVLLDLVWNPSVRKQAISRAYRIGQQKVVYAYNLIASSTLEEKKYNIQDIKDKFSQLVFSVSAKNCTGARLVDMMDNYEDKVLIELIKRDQNASLFQRVIELKCGQGQ